MKEKIYNSYLYSLTLAIIWGVFFQFFLSFTSKGSLKIFAILYGFGHAAEFAFILMVVLFLFSWLPKKLHTGFSLLAGFAVLLFFYCDYITYRQFRIHINMSVLDMFFGPDSSDIFVFPRSMYIRMLFILIVLVAVVLAARFAGVPLWKKAGVKIRRWTTVLLLIFIVAYHLIHAWSSFVEYNPVTKQIHALPITYPLSTNSFLRDLGFQSPEKSERFTPSLMQYPLRPVEKEETPVKYNILIILIDAWRFDMLNVEASPNITAFADESIKFTQHNANANHTRHGVFSLFYGLPGGYWDAAVTDTISPVLMDVAQADGYEVEVFTSAAVTSPEFHKTVFANVKNLRKRVNGDSVPERDKNVSAEFIEFLLKRDKSKPFLSFLFYDAPHAYAFDPKVYPPKFTPYGAKNYLAVGDEQRIPVFNQYRNAVGYADLMVGRVLYTLKSEGYLDNTIVIISGDHGEEFNETGKGYWGHNGNYTIYQTQVPFIIRWPGKEPAVYNHNTNHLDLAVTLLQDLFRVTTPPVYYTTGTNLFDDKDRVYTYMQGDEYAIQVGNIISIFRKLGPVENVDPNYDSVDKRIPADVMKEVLKDLSRFKK